MKIKRVMMVCIMAMFFTSLFATSSIAQEEVDPAKAAFDAQYARLKEFIAAYDGLSDIRFAAQHLYVEIANLGPQVLPYIIPEVEAGDSMLALSARWMTRKGFEREEYDDPARPGGSQQYAALLCDWWRAGKAASDARFEHLYAELVAARKAGDQEAVDATLLSLGKLGIAALPNFVEKIQLGDPDLTGVVAKLTERGFGNRSSRPFRCASRASADATPAAGNIPADEVIKWWETDKQHWLIPWPEEPKQADQPTE